MLRKARAWFGRFRENYIFAAKYQCMDDAAEAAKSGWIASATHALRPLPAPTAHDVQVNMLCGHAQCLMGIWASWSLLRYMPNAHLVVHSDGSLTSEDIALWSSKVPGTVVRSREENTILHRGVFESFPNLLHWVENYHFGPKLGAFHTYGDAPLVMDVDTDTLVIRRPDDLINVSRSDRKLIRWNRDVRYAYAYPANILHDVLDGLLQKLPARLNGGFYVSSRFANQDFARIEKALKCFADDPRTDPLRFWMQQTLVAVVASDPKFDAAPFPPEYAVIKGKTPSRMVMRHFAKAPGIRARFFTEGIDMVIDDAISAGHLPPDFPRH